MMGSTIQTQGLEEVLFCGAGVPVTSSPTDMLPVANEVDLTQFKRVIVCLGLLLGTIIVASNMGFRVFLLEENRPTQTTQAPKPSRSSWWDDTIPVANPVLDAIK
mmetsp:Transcript_27010/g.44991  ORF Transcript_27010/g.44991 Transcript_27010/m.44991 type:complete len:105 (+) Transcript_27010:446-760(+)